MNRQPTLRTGSPCGRPAGLRAFVACALFLGSVAGSFAQVIDDNEPGILEPVSSFLENRDVRVPNTDQSIDGVEQSNIDGDVVFEDAFSGTTLSMLGHPITHVASPNDDMRAALQDMVTAAQIGDDAGLRAAAEDLMDILLGTTEGRIYDGFSMLNFNRWKDPSIGAEYFPPDAVPGEYKMKVARDSGKTFISPFDGEERKIWEADINLLYYDGQIDSDTFFVVFPFGHDKDDVLHVNYRIFSLVREDFSPTLVMLDRRMAQNTVSFPFKGFDSVWVAFNAGQVVDLTVKYPPIRMIRGVYDWGWRVHPPRIQFMQPLYEIQNQHTGEIELDPQGKSFAYRNREDLIIDLISDAAPEKKMYNVAKAVIDGTASTVEVLQWLIDEDAGPRGTWIDWADLVKEQRQLPPEAWDLLEQEDGLALGDFGEYNMITVFMNNEMYGEGPFLNEIIGWDQGEVFKVKLINLDKHTHYFRNVDFGTRLHDDILRCCGGGETSFEIMNFKPSYGAPKVAEMQWRAGWGFRPHYDVIQQQGVFPRGSDRAKLKPFKGGFDGTFYGYQYSEEARQGDFRFNPPPFIITDTVNPAPFPLRDADGLPGLVIGQKTEGYGVAQFCPEAEPGFCPQDIAKYNPHGVLNWPPPPLQGVNGNPDHPTELRFPPFLRNPCQGDPQCGDIIPPTGAWRPFLWINPNNGTLFLDPAKGRDGGYWADLTFSHGAPVFAGKTLSATIELPRASGQVFYQFDDLFHDNDIFSPHPLFEGPDEDDSVRSLRAIQRGDALRIRGRLEPMSETGTFADWVTVFDGAAGSTGCTGNVLAFVKVQRNGRFILRQKNAGALSTVCVQSTIGGFADASVN
ncbi:MAG: hypothetical protein D6696_04505 [Acidobacteria bacterium]|nr:MAG: hypothetical protein D6696_04505 [Acidobacteriota bacterium]